MVNGIYLDGSGTGTMTITANRIDAPMKLTNKGHQLSFNIVNAQKASGAFTINGATANGALITLGNLQVTPNSSILYTIEGDGNTITKLTTYSKTPGSSFTVKVSTNAKTTAAVKVDYIIFN